MNNNIEEIFNNLSPQIIDAWNASCTEIGFSQFIEKIKNIIRSEKSGISSNCVSSGWKEEIKSSYLGRGLGWIYFKNNTAAFTKVDQKINEYSKKGEDVSGWIKNTTDANYIWLRFDSIQGTHKNPLIKFQIRIYDSRKYDNKHYITLDLNEASEGEALGKSPFALGFEKSLKKDKNSLTSRYSGKLIITRNQEEDDEEEDNNNKIINSYNKKVILTKAEEDDEEEFLQNIKPSLEDLKAKGKLIITRSRDEDDEDDISYINKTFSELLEVDG